MQAAVALKCGMSQVSRHRGEMRTLFVAWMLGFKFGEPKLEVVMTSWGSTVVLCSQERGETPPPCCICCMMEREACRPRRGTGLEAYCLLW